MRIRKIVTLEMNSFGSCPWAGREKWQELLKVFEAFKSWNLQVDRYGTSERRTFPLEGNVDRLMEIWEKYFWCILKAPKPWSMMVVVRMYGKGASNISVYIDKRFFETINRIEIFVELSKSLYNWGEIDYGCIAYEDEEEDKNAYQVGPHTIHGGWRLDQSLPGIYWANFFGPRYVKWLGAKNFEDLPATRKEQLFDGGWLILTRPSPTSSSDETARKLERAITERLGEDAFFDKKKPGKRTRTPPFARG